MSKPAITNRLQIIPQQVSDMTMVAEAFRRMWFNQADVKVVSQLQVVPATGTINIKNRTIRVLADLGEDADFTQIATGIGTLFGGGGGGDLPKGVVYKIYKPIGSAYELRTLDPSGWQGVFGLMRVSPFFTSVDWAHYSPSSPPGFVLFQDIIPGGDVLATIAGTGIAGSDNDARIYVDTATGALYFDFRFLDSPYTTSTVPAWYYILLLPVGRVDCSAADYS